MFRQYTKCFTYKDGDPKPFNEKDEVWVGLKNGALGAFFGALMGVVVGLLVGGPVGAVVGLLVGVFSGVYVGMAMAISDVSNKWLNHRLVCLGGDVCAVGTVLKSPEDGGLGNFDNDEYFELVPMPYPTGAGWLYTERGDWEHAKVGRVTGPGEQSLLESHPANDLQLGNPQGVALMRSVLGVTKALGYSKTEELYVHCEAEGDFWVRMNDLASAIAALAGVGAVATAAGALAGVAAAAAICAAAGLFWLICFIVAVIVIAICTAIPAALTYVALKAALQGVYDANPGDVEDTHIGDRPKDPIVQGDRVAVFGTHVYDGFHDGWNEIHPLKLVMRIPREEWAWYLQWDPGDLTLNDVDPAGGAPLTPDDLMRGLESDAFRRRTIWLKDRWCELISEAFSDPVHTSQGLRSQQWTIHPQVDGCRDVHEHIE